MSTKKKKLPHINVWFDTAARSAWEYDTLDAAIAADKPPPEALEVYTRGYLRGSIMEPINDFKDWLKFMDNEQLKHVSQMLKKLRDEIDAELRKPDAAYKVNGLFDQFDD